MYVEHVGQALVKVLRIEQCNNQNPLYIPLYTYLITLSYHAVVPSK